MTRENIIGQWVTIKRLGWDGHLQTIFGQVEWASEDLRNFRLAGIGHIGLPLQTGTVSLYLPTND